MQLPGLTTSATLDDLMSSNCTTCQVKQDHSNYWTPQLYFQDASTGLFELVPEISGHLT